MNTKGHIITDEQFEEYKKLKKLFDNKKRFRIDFYNIMQPLSSITDNGNGTYTPNCGKDYLEIDVTNVNKVSKDVIKTLEKWFADYERQHDETLKQIKEKMEYLQDNDKDMIIPTKKVKYANHKDPQISTPSNIFNNRFIDFLKGLVKYKW